jgi:tRNA(Ile)-lysidine synthase
MSDLSADFQEHLKLNFPEILEAKSVLALSGGIDSMVLCELLIRAGVNFSMAHCNFQLRGSDSFDDERFVIQRADKLDLEIRIKRFKTEEYAEKNRLSIQMAARELRYGWFEKVVADTGSDFLITAHQADDNLETFLINLSRGSGLKGLTGIPEKRGYVLRPLLPFSREDIMNFATKSSLQWREDRSNAENDYLRNRIRNKIVPVMKESLPLLLGGFRKTLSYLRGAESVAADRLREAWVSCTNTKNGITRIDIEKILSFGDPRAYLYGLLSPFGFTQWDDIEKLLSAQPGKMIFSDSHRLLKDRGTLLLQDLDRLPEMDQDLLISQSQRSLQLGADTLRIEEFAPDPNRETISACCKEKQVACLDADKLKFPMIVRKWQKGDYFYPKGMKGSKKLSKFFEDEKLSIPEKENIWLLCSRKEVAWVIGIRMDDRFKVTEATKRVLRLELMKQL